MHVYPCCYHGRPGYGCRVRGQRWMFVPGAGQKDTRTRRDLSLAELVFTNPAAKNFEMSRERGAHGGGALRWVRDLFRPGPGARSVGAMLFTAD